ncbi:MAG TPA: YifB family Mg chelatase-like AAA ATPase [Anaerovoracaceae bacterium]|nr:YifB family Mg chelatase-like AAA ATPase [Anaerovoracaceae bacterium]
MYARVNTASLYGLESRAVHVEVDVGNGLPAFSVVGLANQSIREAKERIRSAIGHCGYQFPQKRITVNLSPANRKKEGSHFDLPIAVGLLMSTGQIAPEGDDLSDTALIGELTLDGRLEPVEGALPLVIGMYKRGVRKMILPSGNCREAELVKGVQLYPAETLLQAGEHISGFRRIAPVVASRGNGTASQEHLPDFSDIRGQEMVKRAAVIAAAGAHGMLMVGPPGVGKTMIGKRIPGIMPSLTNREQLEISQLYSISGLLDSARPFIVRRPFRAPHHSLSAAAMTGGGSRPRPGEISLAHHGVLFLDELPEFDRRTLDTLRQPMEEGCVTISRVRDAVTFPAKFVLVAAMNPCRCGYYGDPTRKCTCSEQKIKRYLNRISGPLLDRFDIHVEVPAVKFEELRDASSAECSADIKKRADRAREIQRERFKGSKTTCNAKINAEQFEKVCIIDKEAEKTLKDAFESLGLTARAYDRVLKVARTIADLDESEIIRSEHVLEAVQYRSLDRKYWAK